VNPGLLSHELPNFVGPICAQFSVIGGFNENDFEAYSRGVARITLLNPETNERHKLEELVNYVEVAFAISPTTYQHN